MVADDRGQLILVGAIAIALVLLGLVLIVNTALFTQVVGSEGTVETTKDGGLTGQEIGDAIGAVVATENRDYTSDVGINNSVESTVSGGLERRFANRTFESGGAFTSIDYLGMTETGTRTALDAPEEYTDARDDDPNWDPINSSEQTDIQAIFLTIDTDVSTLSNFEMTVHNGSDSMDVRISKIGGGDVEIEIVGPSTTTTCTLTPSQDTLRVDVASGRVYEDGSCTFDAFERLDGPKWVEFTSGDEAVGTYEIVSDDLGTGSPAPRFDPSSGTPTRGDAILAFAYEFTYDSTAATVTSDRRVVDVYD